ncbi:hypothetical protein GCM10011385_32530 [Nitratireductor aestuarii]|uniref:Uncharacterized protein n=2 Tax=Nitratireductor aestuarii TaxID=1735103 RepID=A0A916RXS1_9HYPH|nr:hypothetical protein GCM10011385_32530 [Nitratireductor aestuarii]
MLFMYNKKSSDELEPFVREICNLNGENVVTDFNLDGTPYQETIVEEIIPEDIDIEQEMMCDGNTAISFIRWFVYIKSDPTKNYSYDTDLEGAIYTPADPGKVVAGNCSLNCTKFLFYGNNDGTLIPFIGELCSNPSGFGDDLVWRTIYSLHPDGVKPEGEIIFPEDVDFEKQMMCDGTNSFIRWYVLSKGAPLGISFDTDINGEIVTVTGDVVVGSCNAADDCETLIYSQVEGKAISTYRAKFCPGKDPVYYDANNNVVTLSASAKLFPTGDIDVEQQVMCDGTTTFVRWYVYVKSDPSLNFSYDTGLDGASAFTPAGEPKAGGCESVDDCETIVVSAIDGQTITPYLARYCKDEPVVYYDPQTNEVATPAGTVVPADDVDVKQQVMCDGTTTFVRWYVYVKSNPGLNFSYDTGLDGTSAYTPAGEPKVGGCEPIDDCETVVVSAINGQTITPYLARYCTGEPVVYYDPQTNEVATPAGTVVPADDVDVEQQVMCDGTTTFARWYVYVKSNPSLNFSYDTGLDGTSAFTPAGEPKVGGCEPIDDCETVVVSAIDGQTITPYLARYCTGEPVVYYDPETNEVATPAGTVVPADDVDVEQQVMCDTEEDGPSTTFVRWFVYVKSDPSLNFSYDTDLEGEAHTVRGTVTFGNCATGDCDTKALYENTGDTFKPIFRKICTGKDPVYYDINGVEIDAPAADAKLLLPEDVDVEQQLMCDVEDSGTRTTFVRWYVYVKSDLAQNFSYDTGLDGSNHTLRGTAVSGSCEAADDCETLLYSAVDKGNKAITNYRVKFCPGQDPVYYDTDNNEVEFSTITGTLVPIEDVDVEQQAMCDVEESTETSTTFIRWQVYVKSDPSLNFSYDTDVDGNEYTLRGTAEFGSCAVDDCETRSLYQWEGANITPIFQKRCRGKEPVYYDINGAKTDTPPATATLLLPEDLDVTQQLMCDGDPEEPEVFLRWHVSIRGRPSKIFNDTDLNGAPLTRTPDPARVMPGFCPDCPKTTIVDICDILPPDVYETEYGDENSEGTPSRLRNPATDKEWVALKFGGIYQNMFYFIGGLEFVFDEPVTIEYTLSPGYPSDVTNVMGIKGELIALTGDATFNNGSVKFPAFAVSPTATFRETNILNLTMTADQQILLTSLKFLVEKEPIPLILTTKTTCEGRVTETLQTLSGEEYKVVGTLGPCKS